MTEAVEAETADRGPPISDLNDIDGVRAYLERIGAEPRSMKSAVIRERDGRYWQDWATIRFDKATGAVTVKTDDDALREQIEPTEAERALIETGIKGARWPELKPLMRVVNPPKLMREARPEDVFEFRDPDRRIRMVQVRVEKNGEKEYLPFTYWSDDRWRMCEPDDPLPLFNADKIKDNTTVFIHEGAKAARAMQEMIDGETPEDRARLAEHPWGRELSGAAHVGWIGGALSPHRTDWETLAKAGVKRVYVVADNDRPGREAIPAISKLLRSYPIVVVAVRFDDKFPPGFDLADDFPETLFAKDADGEPRYTGPSFHDCRSPATWATKYGPTPKVTGKGRPPAPKLYLRKEFAEEWWMVAGEGKPIFINHHHRWRLYSEEGFNTAVFPFSDTGRTSDLFKAQAYASHVNAIAYEPGDKEGAITVEGERCVNTWTDTRIRPDLKGDDGPWLEFMEHLFPVAEDRHEAMRWCATLIARPRVRMRYGLLLASTVQGVGKTSLCEILRVLVGEKNCRSPSARDIVDSAFNSWIVRKRFVFVNEIYEGKSWGAYQKMKSFITDGTLEANEKMIRSYSIRNWAHFVLCSNSEVPLWVEDDDRRFLVPEVTERKRDKEAWNEFHEWLAAGGYAIIAGWAERFLAKHDAVRPSDEAPTSARKRKLIEDSRSHEELKVRDLVEAAKKMAENKGRQVVLVEREVVLWLKNEAGRDLKPNVVRGWLRKAGLFVSKARLTVDGLSTYVAGTRPLKEDDRWSALSPDRVKPEDLAVM